jgi:hypothetical protein
MNVVVRTDDGAVSLLVDEIGDVRLKEGRARSAPPMKASCGDLG